MTSRNDCKLLKTGMRYWGVPVKEKPISQLILHLDIRKKKKAPEGTGAELHAERQTLGTALSAS